MTDKLNLQPLEFVHGDNNQFVAKQVVRLPDEDSGLTNSIVRLDNSRIGIKPTQVKRRKPLRIQNIENGQWIIRYCMGNGGKVKGLLKEFIALDYDGVNDLGIDYKEEVKLSVREANLFDITRWFWGYPDLNVKLSFRLGLLGFVLGVVSFIDMIF